MDDQERKALGLLAEELALAHLLGHGLKLIKRNYRCKLGEIDLVMLDGQTLVLIEVRYRGASEYGGAAASVTREKQRKLINTADHLLIKRADLRRYPARFDVIAITTAGASTRIEWLKRAFTV